VRKSSYISLRNAAASFVESWAEVMSPPCLKQAAAVSLFKTMKGVFTTAGGVHDSLKKEFTPEGLLLGYNTMYFDDPKGSPLLKQFVREYKAKHNEDPPYGIGSQLLADNVPAGDVITYLGWGICAVSARAALGPSLVHLSALTNPRTYKRDDPHLQTR